MIKIGNDISSFSTYSCRPASKKELKEIINDRISKEGPNCDLNDIDTSLIIDMSSLFYESSFNGNISRWNVSKVTNMGFMFAESRFNQDISEWNVSNVVVMTGTFSYSIFNQPISNWYVSNVKSMIHMFRESKFNQDISNWKIRENCITDRIFTGCPIQEEYKPKTLQ